MESVTCLRCRSATPPVLMHQDRRVAPPSITTGMVMSFLVTSSHYARSATVSTIGKLYRMLPKPLTEQTGPGSRSLGPSSCPYSPDCRQGGFPETL